MDDDSTPKRPTRKEVARKMRRDAYQKAKARRATDPRYLAMKEGVKQRRREAHQRIKARRKAAAAEKSLKDDEKRAQKRAAADDKLMDMVKRFTGAG